MSKIYLAASFDRRAELVVYARQLRDLGHEVTSRWINTPPFVDAGAYYRETPAAEIQQLALSDWCDLTTADWCVFFADPPASSTSRGGRHTELGIALAYKLRVLLVGEPENVFHYLPGIERFRTWEALLITLARESARSRDAGALGI